jgi:uncharacterized UBP type Zn finger protein
MTGSSKGSFKRNSFAKPLEHLVLSKLVRVDKNTYDGERVERLERFGLIFYGFNCYINSVLQSMFACKTVMRYFKQMPAPEVTPLALLSIKKAFDASMKRSDVQTEELIYQLTDAEMELIYSQQIRSPFEMTRQQDASEFFQRLLDSHLCNLLFLSILIVKYITLLRPH